MKVKGTLSYREYCISSVYTSVPMQHKIVTVTLIFIHNMFWPYTTIIRCPHNNTKITTNYTSGVIGLQRDIYKRNQCTHPLQITLIDPTRRVKLFLLNLIR
jgi:hypothetical protein